MVLAVMLSGFTLTGCHELYCNFVEGLTGTPLDCSHEAFPDLGDIDFPPLPPPPSLPSTTTSLATTTTTVAEPTTTTTEPTGTTSTTSSTVTTSTSPTTSTTVTDPSTTMPSFDMFQFSFDPEDLEPDLHDRVPTRTVPERRVRAGP